MPGVAVQTGKVKSKAQSQEFSVSSLAQKELGTCHSVLTRKKMKKTEKPTILRSGRGVRPRGQMPLL